MKPSPVDIAWDGVSVVVPLLPSRVQWSNPSGETLIAFERACRSIGHLGGAYRATRYGLAGLYVVGAMEAVASAAMVDREANWSRLRDAMTVPGPLSASMTPEDRAARLLLAWAGQDGTSGRGYDPKELRGYEAALRMWPSALDRDGRMPERFARSLAADLAGWATDQMQPSVVKAAVAMMVVAASDPESGDTGILARSVFGMVLEAADGSDLWKAPPISAHFLHCPEDWTKVATALAGEGEPDPVAVDLAMRATFNAVAHSAIAAAYRVEHAGASVEYWIKDLAPAKLSRNQRTLLSVLTGVPSLTDDHVESLLGVTSRGARRITKGLIDAGLVVQQESRRGGTYVMARHGFTPWLGSVALYQVPGGPDPYDQRK